MRNDEAGPSDEGNQAGDNERRGMMPIRKKGGEVSNLGQKIVWRQHGNRLQDVGVTQGGKWSIRLG